MKDTVIIDRKTLPTWPEWYHPHGDKMHLKSVDPKKGEAIIANNAATLTIQRLFRGKTRVWLISWQIAQNIKIPRVFGTVLLEEADLANAFGLIIKKWMVFFRKVVPWYCNEQFYTTPRKYIRQAVYLNIPNPGTGQDNDPNVSVCLDDRIIEAVRQLLAA